MIYILAFVQGGRTNWVGSFAQRENAVAFLKSIPFVREQTDEYGTVYTMRYRDIPALYMAQYNSWQYPISKFSYGPERSAGEIEAELLAFCQMDETPNPNFPIVEGMTAVDAYTHSNAEIPAFVKAREAFFRAARACAKRQGKKLIRRGLGSEDGEYVLISQKEHPTEYRFAFLLDPETVAAWEKTGATMLETLLADETENDRDRPQ